MTRDTSDLNQLVSRCFAPLRTWNRSLFPRVILSASFPLSALSIPRGQAGGVAGCPKKTNSPGCGKGQVRRGITRLKSGLDNWCSNPCAGRWFRNVSHRRQITSLVPCLFWALRKDHPLEKVPCSRHRRLQHGADILLV